jgi:hypothetical protein
LPGGPQVFTRPLPELWVFHRYVITALAIKMVRDSPYFSLQANLTNHIWISTGEHLLAKSHKTWRPCKSVFSKFFTLQYWQTSDIYAIPHRKLGAEIPY